MQCIDVLLLICFEMICDMKLKENQVKRSGKITPLRAVKHSDSLGAERVPKSFGSLLAATPFTVRADLRLLPSPSPPCHAGTCK